MEEMSYGAYQPPVGWPVMNVRAKLSTVAISRAVFTPVE
jgi:hypothetical protein